MDSADSNPCYSTSKEPTRHERAGAVHLRLPMFEGEGRLGVSELHQPEVFLCEGEAAGFPEGFMRRKHERGMPVQYCAPGV